MALTRGMDRRSFFKVLVGTVAAAAAPAMALEPLVVLEPVPVLPAVDWYKRVVRYNLEWDCWDIYGVSRVGEHDWELDMRFDFEPGWKELALFDQTFKTALAKWAHRG